MKLKEIVEIEKLLKDHEDSMNYYSFVIGLCFFIGVSCMIYGEFGGPAFMIGAGLVLFAITYSSSVIIQILILTLKMHILEYKRKYGELEEESESDRNRKRQ